MKIFEVGVISGHDLKFHVITIKATNEAEAITNTFNMIGANFENKVVSIKEVKA